MSLSDTFDISKTLNTMKVTFSSTMKNVDKTCDESIVFFTDQIKDVNQHLFAIQLVMREGLTNAVRHGNKFQIDKLAKSSIKETLI